MADIAAQMRVDGLCGREWDHGAMAWCDLPAGHDDAHRAADLEGGTFWWRNGTESWWDPDLRSSHG